MDVERAGVANEDTITMIRKEKQDKEKELGTIRDALAEYVHLKWNRYHHTLYVLDEDELLTKSDPLIVN